MLPEIPPPPSLTGLPDTSFNMTQSQSNSSPHSKTPCWQNRSSNTEFQLVQCGEKLGMTNMHGYWKSQSWGKGVLGRKIDNIRVGEAIEIAVHSYYFLVAMVALYYSTLPHPCTAPGRAGYGTALLPSDWCRLL